MRQFTQYSNSGFTIVELLVAMTIGLLILSMVLQTTMASKDLYSHDVIRTRLNQDLRSSLDIIGTNIRQSGENLTKAFPAIQIVDHGTGSPDELVLSRNLHDQYLQICTQITQGTGVSNIFFADNSTTQGCSYSANTTNYNAWRQYRLDDADHSLRAYIYNPGTGLGEFFDYVNEHDGGTNYYITRGAGTWANTYQVGSAGVYILEEWRFKVANNTLQLIQNQDTTNTMNVAFGFTNFQVRAKMNDGTILTALNYTNNWALIDSVEVTLAGQDSYATKPVVGSLSAEFFPRNVLSN